MEGIVITCVSTECILYDLADCIRGSPVKQRKRMNRLKKILHLYGYTPSAIDAYVADLSTHICKNEQNSVTLKQYCHCNAMHYPADIIYRPFVFEYVVDHAKNALASSITAKMNSLYTYKLTCTIAYNVWLLIQADPTWKPLVDSNDIMFIYKGSNSQRLSLLHNYGHIRKNKRSIDYYFNGHCDNDCLILINPQLESFRQIHTDISDLVYRYMSTFPIPDLLYKAFSANAKKISKIHGIPCRPYIRSNAIITHITPDMLQIKFVPNHSNIYLTYNNTIKFMDNLNRLAHFTLLRYKYAFMIGSRLIGADVLDISIPFNDDEKMVHTFPKYKSGEYTQAIKLNL